MSSRWAIRAAAVLLCGGIAGRAGAGRAVVLADFDMPPPNNLDGWYGVFSPSETEAICIVVETLDDVVKHGNGGAAMRLEYDVTRDGSFNGFWMKLGPEQKDRVTTFDASDFVMLTFWIRGDHKAGIPRAVKVELKDEDGQRTGVQYVSHITRDWQKVCLPLKTFRQQGVDLGKLDEFVLVFEYRAAFPATRGTIWIDRIAFE